MYRTILATLVVAFAIAACGGPATPTGSITPTASTPTQAFQLLVQPPPGPNFACMDALAGGDLVVDPRSGLGLRSGNDSLAVSWPFGYSAAIVDGVPVLIDDAGQVIARAGDSMSVPGGMGAVGLWAACPPITVNQR
jgi:hypothetical protein